MNIGNPDQKMNLFSLSLSVRNSTGWDIMEAVVVVGGGGGCVCGFVYGGVTFFLTSYFHTTSFIMLICEVERNAGGVERSGAPAA